MRIICKKMLAALLLLAFAASLVFCGIGQEGKIEYVRDEKSKLSTVSIDRDVNELPNELFLNANSLLSIRVHQDNRSFASRDNWLYSKDFSHLLLAPVTGQYVKIVIPSGITHIGERAFQDRTSLSYVDVPEGALEIGMSAFASCANLNFVVLPVSLERVDLCAFFKTNIDTVYYKGDAEGFGKIEFGSYNKDIKNASLCFYSEEKPTEPGSFWHYDESGFAVKWN